MDKETGLPEGASTYSAGTNTDPWTEVRIEVPAERIDAAGDIAHMTVPYGIYLEDYRFLEEEIDEIAHIDLIDEALKDKDRTKGVVHIYLEPGENPAEAVAFLQEQYAQAGIPSELTVIPCRNEDWQDNWKKFFKPTEVGQKLLIQPVWEVEGSTSVEPTSDVEPQDVPSTDRKILYLEPGLAFGTGTHETTHLCLLRQRHPVHRGPAVRRVESRGRRHRRTRRQDGRRERQTQRLRGTRPYLPLRRHGEAGLRHLRHRGREHRRGHHRPFL